MNVTPALASRIHMVEQGSLEWFMLRCGKCTASEVINALAIAKVGKNKGGDTEGRRTYKASIVAEILTGEPDMEGYATSSMNRGTNEEPRARAAYEIANDVDVDIVGFVIHPTIKRAGSSPDGLVSHDGMLEIKNPKTKNHISYMLSGELPDEYEPQVMFSLACTERDWCDFLSFDARMPPGLRSYLKRIYRNEQRIAEINTGVLQFFEEVDEVIYQLRKIMGPEPTPPVNTPAHVERDPNFKGHRGVPDKLPEVLDPDLYLTDTDIPASWRY